VKENFVQKKFISEGSRERKENIKEKFKFYKLNNKNVFLLV